MTSNHSNCTPSDPHVTASFINIGAVNAGKGDLENDLVQYQKGLEIQTRVFGSDHPDVAVSYTNIGNVYYRQGQYERALENHQKALEIFIKVSGQDHRGCRHHRCGS